MDPQTQTMTTEQKMELLRRRASLGAAFGSQEGNSPQSPIPQQMQTNPQTPSGGAGGAPSTQAAGALKQQGGEAKTLINALIYRLKQITTRGE